MRDRERYIPSGCPMRCQLVVGTVYDPDEQSIEVVAYRLIKSQSWMRHLIAKTDFQYHYYVGRRSRWSEFQALRSAKITAGATRNGRLASRSKPVADIGTGLQEREGFLKTDFGGIFIRDNLRADWEALQQLSSELLDGERGYRPDDAPRRCTADNTTDGPNRPTDAPSISKQITAAMLQIASIAATGVEQCRGKKRLDIAIGATLDSAVAQRYWLPRIKDERVQ